MINPDILRIMAELYTFTAEDLAEALDCPVGTVGGLLPAWVRERYLVRFKFRRTFLYALSTRGERLHAKLPLVDPEERCLMLVHLPVAERYMYYRDTPVIDTSTDDVFTFAGECTMCGKWIDYASRDGRCGKCEQVWNS